MQLTDLSFKVLITFIAVAILGIEIYNKIYTARKNFKAQQDERSKPVRDLEARLNQYDQFFQNDKFRLEALERRLDAIDVEMKGNKHENSIMMKMLLALTRHAIDGNNIEGLKRMSQEVQDYLTER